MFGLNGCLFDILVDKYPLLSEMKCWREMNVGFAKGECAQFLIFGPNCNFIGKNNPEAFILSFCRG
jgi:hypothetical protein